MEDRPPFPESTDEWYEAERTLSEQEVIEFQEQVVQPAVRYLFGGIDFLEVATGPNDNLSRDLRLGDAFYQFKIGNSVDDDADDPEGDDSYVYIEAVISRVRSDLVDQIVQIHHSEIQARLEELIGEGQSKRMPDEADLEDEPAEEDEGEVQVDTSEEYLVWETRKYSFNFVDSSDLTVSAYLELMDEDDDIVWSSLPICTPIPNTDETTITYSDAEELGRHYGGSITSKDVKLIKKTFARLGVPQVLLG